jgi:hypothetical protein
MPDYSMGTGWAVSMTFYITNATSLCLSSLEPRISDRAGRNRKSNSSLVAGQGGEYLYLTVAEPYTKYGNGLARGGFLIWDFFTVKRDTGLNGRFWNERIT